MIAGHGQYAVLTEGGRSSRLPSASHISVESVSVPSLSDGTVAALSRIAGIDDDADEKGPAFDSTPGGTVIWVMPPSPKGSPKIVIPLSPGIVAGG